MSSLKHPENHSLAVAARNQGNALRASSRAATARERSRESFRHSPLHLLIALTAAVSLAADAQLTPQMQAAIGHISANSLRGHLSFLASDLLEGRGTPSRGLDLAAEYIASEFRAAGLEPAGDDGYFQTATVVEREQNPEGFEMTVTAGGKTIRVDSTQASIVPEKALALDNAPIVAVDGSISAQDAAGKVVLMTGRRGTVPSSALLALYAVRGAARPTVTDPEIPERGAVRNTIAAPELVEFLKRAHDAHVKLHVAAGIERSAKVRNVAGLLRGSDPALRDTYVLLTAHYDHLGIRGQIFNGANDDGSGTVSVMEIASALASVQPRPKRSILFMTFFGEERGLTGSRYYGRHPIVPLANTIADLNLEQVGRTDATNGPQVGTASITGFDYSDLPRILTEAGRLAGVKVYKDPSASDPYFARSDNQALADAGIPAHTLCVAFDYPDYHGAGDKWEKIDYANMAKVDRAVTLGVLRLASDERPPKWNESVAGARKYVEAAKRITIR